jgi:hypothetical protein
MYGVSVYSHGRYRGSDAPGKVELCGVDGVEVRCVSGRSLRGALVARETLIRQRPLDAWLQNRLLLPS